MINALNCPKCGVGISLTDEHGIVIDRSLRDWSRLCKGHPKARSGTLMKCPNAVAILAQLTNSRDARNKLLQRQADNRRKG